MTLSVKILGTGCESRIRVYIDSCEEENEIGSIEVGSCNGVYSGKIKCVSGRHALFFKVEYDYEGYFAKDFEFRNLFDLCSFAVFK